MMTGSLNTMMTNRAVFKLPLTLRSGCLAQHYLAKDQPMMPTVLLKVSNLILDILIKLSIGKLTIRGRHAN